MNGNHKLIWSVIAAVFLGLSGWILYSIDKLSIGIARLEQDDAWIKAELVKLDQQTGAR